MEIVKRHPKADAIVSFAGVPNPEHAEMKGLELKDIRFIAEARQPLERVKQLFDRNALDVAIVPRFTFPAPSAKHRKTPHDWFDTYFQVLRRNQ